MPTTYEIRKHVNDLGFTELKTSIDVRDAFKHKDFFLFINSTCPNSSIARMVLDDLLKVVKLPKNNYTVFAGQDIDATRTAREILNIKPSSPAFYTVRDNKVVYVLDRDAIITQDKHVIIKKLADAILHTYH
jgi:putative YphP/YqiW family bacilliredoxin